MSSSDSLNTPIAHIFGEPVFQSPTDLFIPPDALTVFLDRFEGPLDLLLYLIRRQNINILDIPMTEITTQYLAYISSMQALNIELAADYLLMAAVLIEIKSRMLLPRPQSFEPEHEAPDPRAQLVERLLAYEQIRQGARALDALPQAARDFFWLDLPAPTPDFPELPDVSAEQLRDVFQALMRRVGHFQHHQLAVQHLSVREQMARILRLLEREPRQEFEQLFAPFSSVSWIVVSFLAVLELAREGLVKVWQAEPFAQIWVSACVE